MLREYELTLITSGQIPESQRAEVYTKYEQMVTAAGGSVLTKDEWGLMKLAHPIQKQFRGHYMCYRLAAPPDVFTGIEPKLRIDPAVLRYLKIKVSDAHDAEHWAAELSRLAATASDSIDQADNQSQLDQHQDQHQDGDGAKEAEKQLTTALMGDSDSSTSAAATEEAKVEATDKEEAKAGVS